MSEQVREIAVSELHSFKSHPFHVTDDASMQALCESIKEYGILSPLLARPSENGYEIISGHGRKAVAVMLGMDKLPVLVREMTDDEATILMVDSNLQRENILPSEKAFAFRMKLEAMKHQGKATSCKVCAKSRTDEIIAADANVSARTIQNYIRLTNLAKPILDMVDAGRIAFSPAVELSFLTLQEQAELWDIIRSEDCTPSLSQAVRLKKLSQSAQLSAEKIYDIMREEKANQKERLRFEVSSIRKYFPRNYTAAQMEQFILKMLDEQYHRRQRK
ncbi:MAG: ParB/RepB/Spo0J family partition protein [Oscillospiraceae bacterium]